MDDYIPTVLVYDDKEDQRKTVELLLEDHFKIYTATPATLASELRDTIDVIVTDVEIIEEGKAERQGYFDVERVLKDARMARPVIVYTTVADLDIIKNSPMGQGEFFFGYVERRGFDWEKPLIGMIREAYTKRFPQKAKMFAHWLKEKGIYDQKISEETIEKLRITQETPPEDFETVKEITYATVVDWLAQVSGEVSSAGPPGDPQDLAREAKSYEEILFACLMS